jgi:hypothetical protein
MRALSALTAVIGLGAVGLLAAPAHAGDWSIGVGIDLPGAVIVAPGPLYVRRPQSYYRPPYYSPYYSPDYYPPEYYPPPRYYRPPGYYQPGRYYRSPEGGEGGHWRHRHEDEHADHD